MQSLPALLGLAVILFVSTNLDDLFVVIGFYAHSSFRARDIVAGQYAGAAVLFMVSVVGALLSLVIPKAPLGLLGIFPILIGVIKLLELRQDRDTTAPTNEPGFKAGSHGNIVSVALVAIANGGDNIGIYVPSFAIHSGSQIAIIGLAFVAMTGLLCILAHRMVSHPTIGAPLRRYAHLFVPMILIALGIWILHEAGTIPWLLRHV
jgi:cadmium resistance protein CadD (predicted permease)